MSWLWNAPVTFAAPWAIVAPFLYLTLLLLSNKREEALLYPSGAIIDDLPKSIRQTLRLPVLTTLFIAYVIFLTLALMQPREVVILPEKKKARSMMLSLDISRSMKANDFRVGYQVITRLEGVKQVVKEFLEGRKEDRIGLVVFGSSAFLQSPLTFDHELLSQIMTQLRVGIAGDGTAIGDGLGIALKRLESIPAKRKAIILMTDGVSNSGKVAPLQAAKVAKELGVVVHTIGIGPDEGTPIQLPFGIGGDLLTRERHFDEETLKKIAQITGGKYFHASNTEKLHQIYREIDTIEQIEESEPARTHIIEHFEEPLILALLCYILYCLLGMTYFRKIP